MDVPFYEERKGRPINGIPFALVETDAPFANETMAGAKARPLEWEEPQ